MTASTVDVRVLQLNLTEREAEVMFALMLLGATISENPQLTVMLISVIEGGDRIKLGAAILAGLVHPEEAHFRTEADMKLALQESGKVSEQIFNHIKEFLLPVYEPRLEALKARLEEYKKTKGGEK